MDKAPLGRAAEASEIASTIDFLLGPGANYVTGTDILVDGGALAALLAPQVT